MEQTSKITSHSGYRKKKTKYKYAVWAILLLLILAFVITGIATDWFGLYGPVSKIAIASAKTFQTQNFSADFKINNGKFYAEGSLQLYIDTDSETVEAYIEALSGKTVYIAAIYKNKLIYGTQKHLFAKDIQPQLESFFQKQNDKPPKIQSIDDALDLLLDLIPDPLLEKINKNYLDLDSTKELLKSFIFQKLNRTSWLKEHAGYNTYRVDDVRYHTFRNEKGSLLSDVLEHFKPAFVTEGLYNRLCQSAHGMQNSNTATETLFAIEDGLLCKYETITRSPDKTAYISIVFHSIGTTTLDQAQLNNLLKRANS